MSPLPGDYGVVRTTGFVAACIRLATRSPANHAFIYVGAGQIIEARPEGARWGTIVPYPHVRWSTHELTDVQREAIMRATQAQVGMPYGYLDIAALGLNAFGIDLGWADRRVNQMNTRICSQLVAVAYAAAGIQLAPGKLPAEVTPADLLIAADGL